jgi:uncharacterized integral membrane protein
MRNFNYLVVILITAICLGFAYANRQVVTVNFDPLGYFNWPSREAPVYAVALIAAAIGLCLGAVSTWFGQSEYRRRARDAEAHADRLRADLQRAARATPAAAAPVARQA